MNHLAEKHLENIAKLGKKYHTKLETAYQLSVRRDKVVFETTEFARKGAAEVYRFLSEGGTFKTVLETDREIGEAFLAVINPVFPVELLDMLTDKFDHNVLPDQELLNLWNSVMETHPEYQLQDLLKDEVL